MSHDDIQKLIAAILDGDLSEEQFATLENVLINDPAARELYRHQLQIHTLLMYGTHPSHSEIISQNSGNDFANFVRESSGKSTWEVELYKKAAETILACQNNEGQASPQDITSEISLNPLLSSLNSTTINANRGVPLPSHVTNDTSLHSDVNSSPVFLNWLTNNTRILTFSFFAALVLGIGFSEAWIRFRSPTQIVNPTPLPAQKAIEQPTKTSPIAVLVSANGCDLNVPTAHKNFVEGDGVLLGEEVTLREGIADFRLSSSGVLLSIEGPASFVITSSNSLIMRQGKMTAHVPWAATNFNLMAGPYRLTAFDSEFGVNVRGNSTSVHVFSGEVTCLASPFSETKIDEVDPEDMDTPLNESLSAITISNGKAVELSPDAQGDTSIKHLDADPNQFANRMSMAGYLQIDSSYVDTIKKSRPIGYWRFEEVKNNTIQNEIDQANPLRVTSELTLRGDNSNRFLDLGHGFAKGNLVSVKTMDALSKENVSFEMWFKPSHYHRGFLLAFANQLDKPIESPTNLQNDLKGAQYERNGFRLELQRDFGLRMPGTIACAFRYPLGVVTTIRASSNELYHLRRWQHLVVVKGKSALIMYLDGKSVAYSKGSTAIPTDMHVVVGRPFPSFNDFPYFGQLDELAIYNRVLTSEEVNKHFKAGEDANRPKTGI